MPNTLLHDEKRDFSVWTQKYLQNQLKLCVVFNYYFPNGNYRNYFDYYMLKKFESMSGSDDVLDITKHISEFAYMDFETQEGEKVKTILAQFYNKLKEEQKVFNNGLERFMYAFDLACRCYNNNGTLELRYKTGDFFVYKLGGPYLENTGEYNEGHITDGYIGQHMRFIALRQVDYAYKNISIRRPIHLVWRDAHANCIAYNDSLWITELNKFKNIQLYFLPNSISYTQPWHDYAVCSIQQRLYKRSAIAGVIQILSPAFPDDDKLYLKIIGLPFILHP